MSEPLKMRDRAPGKFDSHEERLDGQRPFGLSVLLGLNPHGPAEPTGSTAFGLVLVAVFLTTVVVGVAQGWPHLTVMLAAAVALLLVWAVSYGVQRILPRKDTSPDEVDSVAVVRVRPAARRAAQPIAGALFVMGMFLNPLLTERTPARSWTVLYLALVPVSWALFRAFVLAGAGDLEIEFRPHPARGGEDVQLRIAQGARGTPIRRMELRLLCLRSKEKPRHDLGRVLFEDRIHLEERAELPTPGGAVEVTFRLPDDAPPSEPEKLVWRVDIRIWSGFGSFSELFWLPVVARVESPETA